jgi:signal transduction histidine kinase
LLDSQTRLDLARRLHDGLAQDLALLGYRLDEVIGDPRLDQHLRDSLRRIRIEFATMSTTFRDEIYRIRLLHRNDLVSQLGEILVKHKCELDLDYPALNEMAEDALTHCLVEIARNSARHGNSTEFSITWQISDGALELICRENGSGQMKEKERSFGLVGIREWLNSIGASSEFTRNNDETLIRLTIPEFSRLAL